MSPFLLAALRFFWVFVEVSTDDGITGTGECYGVPVSGDVASAMVEDTFTRYLEGEDPHHPRDHVPKGLFSWFHATPRHFNDGRVQRARNGDLGHSWKRLTECRSSSS